MTSRPPNSDAGASDESRLRRWSRRKQAAREHGTTAADSGKAPAPEALEEAVPERDSESPAAASDESETLTDADMPPIESLDGDSDYSQFLSPGVSDSLRRMALRKLFGMSAFNVRDGLDDYDEDFTRYQSLGDTVTADMKYQAQRRARLAENHEASPETADEAVGTDETPLAPADEARTEDEPDEQLYTPAQADTPHHHEDPSDERG